MLFVQLCILSQRYKTLVITVKEEPEKVLIQWASVHVYYVIEHSVKAGWAWFMGVFDADFRDKLKDLGFVGLLLTPFVAMQALDTSLQGFTSNQVVSNQSEWWHKLIVTEDLVNWTQRTCMFEITCYTWIFGAFSSPVVLSHLS